ncbi:uncharacterized protein LOC121398308 isoform X6 [Xenopus laevis]|uniref:Uncharacterized protein LOC121398308 isoform X6 n=1 Tax=Xenopus laevis TaxID=8355 RepID=A0A8J1LUW6_XENLA|nr:uncharacterized protein LOC121398308 isoform X6 [Xenopus laevis]
MSWSKQTAVGIFSRSGEDEYLWLVNALRDDTNICPQPFVITNSNASAFRESVRTNTSAILYHSIKRGRLNITDVTDSLYDDELQVLSSILGKDKVMVIADDIDDSSHNAKNRILHSQPTIKLKARDLFLFSREDKTNYNILISKMAPIKEIITAASHKSINMLSLLFACTMVSLWLRRNIRVPDISHILSLVSYVPNLVTLGCACSDPRVKKLLVLAGVLVLSWYLFLLPDKSVFFSMGLIITTIAVGSLLIISASNSHSMLVMLIWLVVTYLEMNIILWMEVASYYATLLVLAGVLVLSWYLFLLPDKPVFFSMGLIITTIAVGSLLIIFASKSHSMLVKLICVVVTYLEMNIILWMEVASYYATILLTFLSSGIAVLIIAKRFNSSARVSHEVNYPDTLLAGVLVLSWYLFLLPDKSVFFSMGLIITTIAVGSLLIIFASNSHSMRGVLIWAALVTYLEMNIILWMEVASYHATILLTFLSSGIAVLIIAKRFNSSARVSHEVNYPDTLLAGVLVLSWYLFLLPDKSVFFSHSMLVMLICVVVTYLEMNIILWMEVASYYATLLAGVLVLSWYLFLLPDKSVFFSMGLIITTIAVGSLLIIFASKSHSMLVKLICVVVTYLEMNIILWMEVASYYATILLTFLSSGTAVLIIAKRFNSSARVSHEVNYPDTSPRSSKKATIGIFSRSSPEEYNWLISYLIKSTGHTVLPFVITNTNSFKFREEVYRCNYAILYHSMRTGRINITDVTDSLYDNELEYLSSELGIDKVAVVVDDLDDRSSTARNRILKSQPKIANLAWNIFLIDKETKQNNSIMRNLMNPIKEKFMTEGSGHSLGSAIVPFCFLVLWFAAIIFVRSPDDFYNIILIVITNLKVSFMIYRAAFSGSDSLACPLLPLVSAVLLVEGIVMIWGVWSVQMVPYTVIALGMDLLVIMLFNKGPQIFSGHPRKCL